MSANLLCDGNRAMALMRSPLGKPVQHREKVDGCGDPDPSRDQPRHQLAFPCDPTPLDTLWDFQSTRPSASTLGVAANSSAQCLEVRCVGHDRGRRLSTLKQEVAKSLPISIVASRFPFSHLFAPGFAPWFSGIHRVVYSEGAVASTALYIPNRDK